LVSSHDALGRERHLTGESSGYQIWKATRAAERRPSKSRRGVWSGRRRRRGAASFNVCAIAWIVLAATAHRALFSLRQFGVRSQLHSSRPARCKCRGSYRHRRLLQFGPPLAENRSRPYIIYQLLPSGDSPPGTTGFRQYRSHSHASLLRPLC